MNRRASTVIALLNVFISLVFLLTYLAKLIWGTGMHFSLWSWVGYSYVYTLVFFVVPGLLIWAVILLFKVKQINRNPDWIFSARLFALTTIFNLAAFYTVRTHLNKVELIVINESNYPVSELKIKARNNNDFSLSKLDQGAAKTFDCYCAEIEYPDDTGIKLAYTINGKLIEGYITGPFSAVWDIVNINISNDSTFAETHHYFKNEVK